MIGFRSVHLHEQIPGELYLHSMPGRYEPLQEFIQVARQYPIDSVICLAENSERATKSPDYASFIQCGSQDWIQLDFPIPDYGVPANRVDFLSFITRLSEELRAGKRLLIHCGAGIGRTGTTAVCLLMVLGESRSRALELVLAAGSHPETAAQEELVDWVATRSS